MLDDFYLTFSKGDKVYVDNRIEELVLMFQYSVLCMLSEKEQDDYINRLIKQNNLIPISRQFKKRSDDLIHNIINPHILVKELEKPLSDLNMNDLEDRALFLYLALIDPERFNLSKEKTKEILYMILKLADYAREQVKLKELSGEKDNSFNKRKSANFFIGLLICLRDYFL